MSEQLQTQTINIRTIKEFATKLADPLKTLILSSPDEMGEQEFLSKFVEWRKLLRMES